MCATLGRSVEDAYELYREFFETRPADTVANILLCLIYQARYLLEKQIQALEKTFLTEGGLREHMTKARLASRDKKRRP